MDMGRKNGFEAVAGAIHRAEEGGSIARMAGWEHEGERFRR